MESMDRKKPVTTITLTPEAHARITAKTRIFGGSVASFAAFWASRMSELTDDDLRELQILVDTKIGRQTAKRDMALGAH